MQSRNARAQRLTAFVSQDPRPTLPCTKSQENREINSGFVILGWVQVEEMNSSQSPFSWNRRRGRRVRYIFPSTSSDSLTHLQHLSIRFLPISKSPIPSVSQQLQQPLIHPRQLQDPTIVTGWQSFRVIEPRFHDDEAREGEGESVGVRSEERRQRSESSICRSRMMIHSSN